MEVWSSSVRSASLFLLSFFLTRFRQMTGEPNRLRQPMKWRAAGEAKGVARSTGVGGWREKAIFIILVSKYCHVKYCQ